METIADRAVHTELPRVSFDWTPKGAPLTILSGGNTYPWTVNTPQAGAPDQDDIFYTTTNTLLTFTASVILMGDDDILEYLWNFGDGVKGYGQVVQHEYRTYSPQARVSLCVVDNHRRRVCTGRQLNLVKATPINVHQ